MGDWCEFRSFCSKLNGIIRLVPGGHDIRWLSHIPDIMFPDHTTILPSLYDAPIVKATNGIIVLCHYPMLSWDRSHYSTLHLHGHTHGTIGVVGRSSDNKADPNLNPGYRVDVGVDCWDFAPVSLDMILERIENER